MERFLDDYGYIALLIGTFLEGETSLLVASSLSPTGLFEIPWIICFGFAGSFVSDWLYYLIGRVNGRYFIEKRPKLKSRVDVVRAFFRTHQIQILFTYRFLYGFRVIIPLIVGMSGIRPIQFLGFSLLTGLLWASSVSAVGYSMGKFLDVGTEVFEENIVFIVLGFATFGLIVGYTVKTLVMNKMNMDARH